MIEVYFNTNDERFVWASDLHRGLQIGTKLNTWMPRMIDYGFEDGKDFIRRHKTVTTVNNMNKDSYDWALTLDMAKHIAMVQRTPLGKQMRQYLLGLDKKVNDGSLLNQKQIMALCDICSVMGYFSVQEFFEKEHYELLFKQSGNRWWEERARLFGYTAKEMQEALTAMGIKYKNRRQAIQKLDKMDLIRIGVFDLFRSMGKDRAYAMNVSNTARGLADIVNPYIYNDSNTSIDFKPQAHNNLIADLKNYKKGSNLLQNFSRTKSANSIGSKYSELNLRLNNI